MIPFIGRLQLRVSVSPSDAVVMVNPGSGKMMYFHGSGQLAVTEDDQYSGLP